MTAAGFPTWAFERSRESLRRRLDAAFWSQTDRSGECWEWTGWRRPDGYGVIRRNRRVLRVHRVAYERTFGPIPDGLVVMHTCDNPPCIRPDHLRLGTLADNNHDAASKGRIASGQRVHFYVDGRATERGRLERARRRLRNDAAEAITCSDERHQPGCPCIAGGDPVLR